MAANNDRNTTNPREQLENLMNEAFGERTTRKLFKLCVVEFDPDQGEASPQLFEEFFYLSDEEAVDACRGLVSSLKPYASRRADREGRPKNATSGRCQPNPQGANAGQNPNRAPRREQPAEERELAHH